MHRLLPLAALLLIALGCSSDGRTTVKGKVHLDGTPIAEGVVNFKPVDGKTATASGIVKDGEYSAQVPQGTMRIEISAKKVVGKKKAYPTPDSPYEDIVENAVPAKYSGEKSILKADIAGSSQELNFLDLTSK